MHLLRHLIADKRFRIKEDDIILSDILYAARHMPHEDRLFLMDGDALIIPQQRLMWILERIREHLPRVKRIGAYANVKGIKKKSLEELKQLRENNLGILYYGVETGDDEIRTAIHKGSTAATCIEMGRRVKEAGIQLSATVLLGIGGRERSLRHARATGEAAERHGSRFCRSLDGDAYSRNASASGFCERDSLNCPMSSGCSGNCGR